jgi:predicted nucleic acid-binding protein
LALVAEADKILSEDQDLLILDPWRGVRIIRAADYLARSTP